MNPSLPYIHQMFPRAGAKYSEDQERDEAGRFSSGGGGSSEEEWRSRDVDSRTLDVIDKVASGEWVQPPESEIEQAMAVWPHNSDAMKASLHGEDLSTWGGLYDGSGTRLTDDEIAKIEGQAETLFALSLLGGTEKELMYRGENYENPQEVLAKYQVGETVEFEPLTSATPILDVAQAYAKEWGSLQYGDGEPNSDKSYGEKVLVTMNSSGGTPGVWQADGDWVIRSETLEKDDGGEYLLAPQLDYRVESVTPPAKEGDYWQVNLSR